VLDRVGSKRVAIVQVIDNYKCHRCRRRFSEQKRIERFETATWRGLLPVTNLNLNPNPNPTQTLLTRTLALAAHLYGRPSPIEQENNK